MPTHLLALVPSLLLVVADIPTAETAPLSISQPPAPERQAGSGGLRTDRLSAKELGVWRQIVAIALARNGDGEPMHPTLRRLWDAVDASGHVVHVELSDNKKGTPSYIGARFAVTSVDPTGRSHEDVLVLNLRGIDR